MSHYRKSLSFLRISLDVVLLIISFWVAISIPRGDFSLEYTRLEGSVFLAILIIWFLGANFVGLYDEFRSRNYSIEVITVIRNVFIVTISLIVVLFVIRDQYLNRLFITIFALCSLSLVSTKRLLFRLILIWMRKKGRNLRRTLIIGAGSTGREFSRLIKANPNFGYKLVGFLDDDSEKNVRSDDVLGKLDDLEKILTKQEIDIVIIALPNNKPEVIEAVVRTCERFTTRIKIVPNYFRFISGKYTAQMFGNFPIISVREDLINEFHWRFLKRTIDIMFSLSFMLLIYWWLFPLIALAIKMSSPGPVFFRQERWGRDNQKFNVYKFRSMRNDSKDVDENGEFQQATKDDPRITGIGKILRKTNLDEFPQFINVLKGEMSIVGPRPHPIPLNMESKDKFNLYMYRHIVKPGVTGWAQVNGFRGETSDPEMMQKRIEHDIWYIENWSMWLDIQIVIMTIFNMVKGDPEAY
ncbi:MAG: undecaprenyl-phosphate glucose phosphotransferase [Melioribacteraceae bacterium]|nr:undecaprenyl-phosphate glucose phosphotransferase [Melioribacteraceae bacterium]MCF8414144.1 undecaprenyl-phosphate glucose phosphotransferase [Melioribacteraceae bacterium]